MADDDLTAAQFTEATLVSDDIDVVSRRYVEALDKRDQWRTAVADIEAHLHAVMEGHDVKRYEVPGTGMLEASRRVKRTGWRFDDLLGDIARAVADNRRLDSTGELEAPEWVMARLVQECLSLSSGKVTGIRKHLPADIDEYCKVGEAEPAIRLSRFDR